MPDMTITNQTNNQYAFGPYVLNAGAGTATVTIDTTTNASLYLTDDHFADIVNALYVASPQLITVTNQPTPFPRVTGVPEILHGDGSPEGVVFAPSGSAFMRRDNATAANALYAKTTGPSLSTGWQAFAGSAAPGAATSLPNSPSNGQQAILVDSTSAPTFSWLFQYQSSATKWLFLGGSPLYASVEGSSSPAAQTYALNSGPSITIPVAGVYEVEFGFTWPAGSGQGAGNAMSPNGAGLTAADTFSVHGGSANSQTTGATINSETSSSRKGKQTLTAATLQLYSRQLNTVSGSHNQAWISVRPVTC